MQGDVTPNAEHLLPLSEYFSRGLAGPSATREHDVNPRADDPATPRTRRDFRETWLWEHVLDSG